MTNKGSLSSSDIPHAVSRKKGHGFSVVWVIPIIAAVIGGWMVFKSATEEKATAVVTFESAAGLESGQTLVKLRNIKIGEVTDIRFTDDLSKVKIFMDFHGIKQEDLTDTSRFWVVKPRLGTEGVSGLETLISGSYIEFDPGEKGNPAVNFTGMEVPDVYQRGSLGTRYILKSKELGSLSRGTPVKLRGIGVGSITNYKLSENSESVIIEVFIRAPHDRFVNQYTRFWNTSGLTLNVGAEGIKLDLASIASLVAGGIAFSMEDSAEVIPQATEKTTFTLHDSEFPPSGELITFDAPMKLYFEHGVSGLQESAPVIFKGLRLGTVSDIGVEINDDNHEVITYAIITIEPERLPISSQRKTLKKEERRKQVYQFFESMVAKGLRAQLVPANLLTGQSQVALDFFPTAKKAVLKYVDGMPILPTLPETLGGVIAKIDNILLKLNTLPVEQIAENLVETLESINSLAKSFNAANGGVMGKQMMEVSRNLGETTANINQLIKSYNAAEGGTMGIQMQEVMKELAKASHSIRSLAEYLERHPESLIKGKVPE